MATYNKRGYKQPKPEVEKEEDVNLSKVEMESETAEVFNSLDESASKVGNWFTKNQKLIFGTIGAIALGVVGYATYQNFVVEPKEEDAANKMFQAQQYFEQAINGTSPQTDSLYMLALNGGEGKQGFLGIADTFSGTQAANLSNYYIGISYLNLGKYKEAIQYLEKYKANDEMTKASALGAIGDAFSELKQFKEAYEYYVKAAEVSKDDYNAPRFSFKAGMVALELGNKADAAKWFNNIKTNYKNSPQAAGIEFYIGLAQ